MRPKLVVFAKVPQRGSVKTRLASSIGEEAALAFYVECLGGVLDAVTGNANWDVEIAITPDQRGARTFFGRWNVSLSSQGEGNLGNRLMRFLGGAKPGTPVIIIGSDIPDITADHIQGAVDQLSHAALAIGPSPDGGFWLVGASRAPPSDLFSGVRWSTRWALADTLAKIDEALVSRLEMLEDVDDEESWRRYEARKQR